ncbi:MAG: hypothetical protein RL757_2868 [Bacteroidota bacterium]|jgi:hypothetical protein
MDWFSTLYTWIELICKGLLLLGVLASGAMGLFFLFRKPPPSITSHFMFGLLLLAMSATLLFHLFGIGFLAKFDEQGKRLFLPFNASFWFGPLYFFLVKSRLYPNFALHRPDLKHFVMPVVQTLTLSYIFLLPYSSQEWVSSGGFFSPFYGNFERGVYILQFGLYLYFSYRFILHERLPLHAHSDRHQILLTGWLKRMIKTAFILFCLEASFILTDYFSYKIFQINLRARLLFRVALELSFAAQVAWLVINAFFAWKRKI